MARVARDAGVACQAIDEHVDEPNVGVIVREGDVVLLAVDNHRTRALVDRHVASLDNATLIFSTGSSPGCRPYWDLSLPKV